MRARRLSQLRDKNHVMVSWLDQIAQWATLACSWDQIGLLSLRRGTQVDSRGVFPSRTSVGKAILTNCVLGHRRLVVGSVQGVRGAIGNNPGGPAVDVLTQVITAVDITTIEEQAIKSCRKKD
jgi:hypothetical protein